MTVSPAARGFYFPAEWHPHEATWLSWPHSTDTWPDLGRVLPAYVRFVEMLSRCERVCINVPGEAATPAVHDVLAAARCRMDNIRLYVHPTDDCWVRDHGPSILISRREPGRRLVIDWEFNAWGGKYLPYDADNRIPALIGRALDLELVRPGIVLEGGSIDVNGRGTLMTTRSCLLNPNRNPGLDRQALERILGDHLGVTNVLWLGDGIAGDDTDGHVDDMARFVDERTVVTAAETDRNDENWGPLGDNLKALRGMTLEDGTPLEVVEIPMPGPVVQDGVRLPASYANFYIANGFVIVPVFNDPNDAAALDILERLFPGREVHGIDARAILWGLGGFHCLSQQEPAGEI